jgi:hypothetical protein
LFNYFRTAVSRTVVGRSVCRLNCCWPSPAQLILDSGRVVPHDHICSSLTTTGHTPSTGGNSSGHSLAAPSRPPSLSLFPISLRVSVRVTLRLAVYRQSVPGPVRITTRDSHTHTHTLAETLHGPNRENRLQQFVYCFVCVCCCSQIICLQWKRVYRTIPQQLTLL